ncbi:MAG: hypothetical protein AAGF60_14700 [Pseudomonadota bacterium]
MLDFGALAYLDMHKTGSSTIVSFLQECGRFERATGVRHNFMRRAPRPNVFYLSSVRNPLPLYISLFRYGCDGLGKVQERLTAMGHADLYQPTNDHFAAWMDHMTQAENIARIFPKFARPARLGFGLMTIRHICYSIPRPLYNLSRCDSPAEVLDLYARTRCVDLYIRNESLQDGLTELSTDRLREHFDEDKCAAFWADERRARANRSKSGGGVTFTFSDEMHGVLRENEALLFERFYN